jgi:histidine triad (HIT) family protein
MTECVFCAIVAGRLPAAMVYRDAEVAVFLDNRPLKPGHCLVVPIAHATDLSDVPPAALSAVTVRARLVALAAEHALGAEGAFVALNHRVSQSVPHLHMHVVPRRKGDGLKGFFWPRSKYASDAEAEEIRGKLAAGM